MNVSHDRLTEEIRTRLSDDSTLLVGIDGFGGSGKSTLADRLISDLHDGVVVHMDDFIVKDHMSDDSWEFGWDRERLTRQVIMPVRKGHTSRPQRLIWETNSLSEPVDLPYSRLVVVEGLTSLHPDLFDLFDLTVWVDTPIEESKLRGAARDAGTENESRWDAWARNDLAYQEAYHPDVQAHFQIDNSRRISADAWSPQYLVAIVPPDSISQLLRQEFSFDLIEPHITVKAQPGLEEVRKKDWLSAMNGALSMFGSFDVRLGSISRFGSSVSYLEVHAEKLSGLHDLLMSLVPMGSHDAAAFFEGDGWTPHLTLEQGEGLDSDLAVSVVQASVFAPFEVSSIWLFRQDGPGLSYVRDSQIRLT